MSSNSTPKFNAAGSRLHDRAMQTKLKRIKQKNEQDLQEIEEAYMMAQIPKARPLPRLYQTNDTSLYATNTRNGDVRSLD